MRPKQRAEVPDRVNKVNPLVRPKQSAEVLNRTRLRGLKVRPKQPPSLKRQDGFSIAAAIFLMVVMALLATGMVRILTTSHVGLSQELTASKAYLAGRSALQWGMYQAVYASATGTHTITYSNGALNGTQASIALNSNSVEGETFYTIDSDGQYGAPTDPEYSLRSLQLRFKP